MPGRYRGHDSRDNLFYTASGEVVYSSAGVGIVYNRKTHTQRFFLDHTDDIICVALHPDGTVAATGEIGKRCLVCVWDIENLKCHAKLEGFHTRGVCGLAFSKDGDKLFSVGLDDDHSIACWDWKKGAKIADSKGDKSLIIAIKVSPYDDTIVTVGVKHIKFWVIFGKGLRASKGSVGKKGKVQTHLSIEFGGPNVTLTGTSDGSIYAWKGNQLFKVVQAHEGPVFDLNSYDTSILSGGKDGTPARWRAAFSEAGCGRKWESGLQEASKSGILSSMKCRQ